MRTLETLRQAGTQVSAPSVDRELALARLGGDTKLLREIAVLFLSEDERMMRDIDNAAAARDSGALGRAAHTLKGSVSNFGSDRMYNAALGLERIATAGDLSGLETALQTLREESIQFWRDLRALAAGN